MTVANAAISIYTGEDATITVTIYSDAAQTTPQNITGWSIQFVVHGQGFATAIITKTVGNGITLTTPASGVLTITLAAADTASLIPGQYTFSIARTDTGAAANLTEGNLNLLAR